MFGQRDRQRPTLIPPTSLLPCHPVMSKSTFQDDDSLPTVTVLDTGKVARLLRTVKKWAQNALMYVNELVLRISSHVFYFLVRQKDFESAPMELQVLNSRMKSTLSRLQDDLNSVPLPCLLDCVSQAHGQFNTLLIRYPSMSYNPTIFDDLAHISEDMNDIPGFLRSAQMHLKEVQKLRQAALKQGSKLAGRTGFFSFLAKIIKYSAFILGHGAAIAKLSGPGAIATPVLALGADLSMVTGDLCEASAFEGNPTSYFTHNDQIPTIPMTSVTEMEPTASLSDLYRNLQHESEIIDATLRRVMYTVDLRFSPKKHAGRRGKRNVRA